MKKFMTLLTVLFLSLSMTFAQDYIVDGVEFQLFDVANGIGNHDLSVAHNPTANTFVVSFDYPVDITSVIYNGVIEVTTLTENTIGSTEGAYSLVFLYGGIGYVNGRVDINYGYFTVPEFTIEDVENAFNDGESSVNVDSIFEVGESVGYISGKIDGVASIDTIVIFNNGYNFGIVEGENGKDVAVENAYDAGYTDGENATGTGIYDNIAVTGLNVFPNPANTSQTITVECDNFNNVKVLSLTGQVIYSPSLNTFSVNEFNGVAGMYILQVEDNDFNVTVTRLIVQ